MTTFLIGVFSVICGFVLGAIYGRKLAARAEQEAKELKAAAEERAAFYRARYEDLTKQATKL
ncbi:MAG: hypothetical protein ABSB82_02610 [Terriglobia bacterium]|jgi:uncharacterized membrane protein (DUF485 family)